RLVPSMFLLLPQQCSVADNHSSRSASAVRCRSQPFPLFSESSLAVLPDGKDFFVGLFYNLTVLVCERVFRGTQEMFLQCCSWFRERSLTVLLCERVFRDLFLLCSSCFRSSAQLLTTTPAVRRAQFCVAHSHSSCSPSVL